MPYICIMDMIGGITMRRRFEVEGFFLLVLRKPRGYLPPRPQRFQQPWSWCDIKRNVLADQLARPQILLHENPLQQQEIFRRIFSSRLQIKIPSPLAQIVIWCTLYVPTCTNIGFNLFLKDVSIVGNQSIAEALTKYEQPNMKRDASKKLCLFSQLPAIKKTSFLVGISFHFWSFLFR